MPAMLSGVAFRNEMPFARVSRSPSIHLSRARTAGLPTSIADLFRSMIIRVPRSPGQTPRSDTTSRRRTAATVTMLTSRWPDCWTCHCFGPCAARPQARHLPRPAMAAPTADRCCDGDRRRQIGAALWRRCMFLRDFASQDHPGRRQTPVYTLPARDLAPHFPVATDADCNVRDSSMHPVQEEFADQARCALSAVRTLLQRLRDLDLYDRSAIIVTSDHGLTVDLIKPEDQHPLAGRSPAGPTLPRIESWATPLLLVKPFAAQGPLQTSYAPTAITDVPATLLDLAGLPDALGRGASVLRIDPAEPRQRTYAHHRPQARPNPFYDVLYVFSVNGQSHRPGRLELSPNGIRADGRSCSATPRASDRRVCGSRCHSKSVWHSRLPD